MIDLKNLEAKLDLALANETKESLREWLQGKRLNSFLASLGDGYMEEKEVLEFSFTVKVPANANANLATETPPDALRKLAA